MVLAGMSLLVSACGPGTPARSNGLANLGTVVPMAPAGMPYTCAPGPNEAVQGTYGDAAAIGWAGKQCGGRGLSGRQLLRPGCAAVQDLRVRRLRRHARRRGRTSTATCPPWSPPSTASVTDDLDHRTSVTRWPSAATTTWRSTAGSRSTIPTGHAVHVDPEASAGLVALDPTPLDVRAGATVDHDYVGRRRPLRPELSVARRRPLCRRGWLRPTPRAHAGVLERAAGQRSPQLHLPDEQLVDAYRSGFIYHRRSPEAAST